MRNRINIAFALVALFGLALIACDEGLTDGGDTIEGDVGSFLGGEAINESALNTYSFNYTAGEGPNVSTLLGWQWGIEASKKDGFDFKYLFKNDGSISYVHCCGYTQNQQGCYLLYDNLLVLFLEGKQLLASNITMADGNNSFTWNGATYPRRDADATSFSAPPLALSNKLVGTWKDGTTTFAFGSDGKLQINSAQYGYLVWKNDFLLIGPFVSGQKAGLDKYRFSQTGNGTKLLLKRASDSKVYNLNLAN